MDLTGDTLRRLAAGDLTARIEAAFEPEFESVKNDTNAVAERLEAIITRLGGTCTELRDATGEILGGAADLSERSTRQAATIEETSAAMEQLLATVVANARSAEAASESASAVTQAAEAGTGTMAAANAAMSRISTASEKIAQIIGLIDDIAFQTNLLALNASVEAARAGEAGKGFAVVAIEVRRLAQSAANASRDVKELVERSALEVSSGASLVAAAADQLDQICGPQPGADAPDRRGERGTGDRYRGDQRRGAADGRDDPAQRRPGRTTERLHRAHRARGARPGRRRRGVPYFSTGAPGRRPASGVTLW